MRTLSEWLEKYAESHQNRTNKMIHNVCVPAIMISLVGLLHHFTRIDYLSLGTLVTVITIAFYARLSLKLLPVMIPVFLVMWGILFWVQDYNGIHWFWLAIFILAWIGQFIGHKIEGKKPSFFDDLAFLLIGPIWVFYKP